MDAIIKALYGPGIFSGNLVANTSASDKADLQQP